MTEIWLKNGANFLVAKEFAGVKEDWLSAEARGFKALIYQNDAGHCVAIDPADVSCIFEREK